MTDYSQVDKLGSRCKFVNFTHVAGTLLGRAVDRLFADKLVSRYKFVNFRHLAGALLGRAAVVCDHYVLHVLFRVRRLDLTSTAWQHHTVGFWVLGFGCWVLGFGFQASGFGFRVSGFGFRAEG